MELKKEPHQRLQCTRKDGGPGGSPYGPRDDCTQVIKVTGLADNNQKKKSRRGEQLKKEGEKDRGPFKALAWHVKQ